MARTATTADVFNAVAERHRRDILDLLVDQELSVNELVEQAGQIQPQVSKHLRVLREVDLVRARAVGRKRIYSLNPEALQPIHNWLANYEQMWSERFDQLDVVLQTIDESNGEMNDD